MDDWTPALGTPESDSPIREKFDPTWPYNFKWAMESQSGRVHVWRVSGGTDGRPYHRKEFQAIFGREPRVGDGDIMGLATYIPAERMLDGTVRAPATVLVQAYYLKDIPQGVFDFFETQFPDAAIRRAKIAASGDTFDEWQPDLDSGEEEVVKWVWNDVHGVLIWQADENGLPTHEMKIESDWGRARTPKDWLGYAVPTGTQLELETYRAGTPVKAVQTVKQQLSELYPDQEVILPDEFATNHGVDFNSDPSTYARRSAATAWAQRHLSTPSEMPLEAPVSAPNVIVEIPDSPAPTSRRSGLQWLLGGRRTEAASGADKDGAMVAIFIPSEVGEKIKQKGGEPVEDMHVTLAYFAEKADERDDWEEVERIVEQIAKQHPKLTGKIGGIGVFTNDVDVLWASPNIPGLAELRDDIVEAVEEAGFTVGKDHGWTPHITLKYEFKGKLPKLPATELEIGELSFAKGDDQKHFPFEGAFDKEATDNGEWAPNIGEGIDPGWGPQTWSGWQGAYRFVTDGKTVMSEPEEDLRKNGRGYHGEGHPRLEREFDGRNPKHKGTISGWVIPTQDGEGYGVMAHIGFGDKNEPEMHDVINVLEKEFGKPCHFQDSSADLMNPEMYAIYPEGGHSVGFA
jgi:2'-5' RNA ligase